MFSTVIELPTSELDPKPEIHIWGRCSVRRDGKLLHVDRAGHPSVSSLFNTDDTKEEYNASEPVNDRKRWLDQFVHLMGHLHRRPASASELSPTFRVRLQLGPGSTC